MTLAPYETADGAIVPLETNDLMNTAHPSRTGLILLVLVAALGLHAHSRAFVPAAPAVEMPADTLELSVEAGTPLITALPAAPDDSSVTYEVVRAPALSWLVDRSFFWDTRAQDAGSHEIVFRRTTDARTDTVVLSVTVTQ